MRNKLQEYLALFRLEWAAFFHFPVVEGIFSVLFLIAFVFTSGLTGRNPGISIDSIPTWDGIVVYEYYIEYVLRITTSSLGSIYTVFTFVSVFLISIVTAFNLGKSLEDGFAQTNLSYPIGRKVYITTKIVLLLLILITCSSIAVLSAIYIFIPGPKPFSSVLLFFISYCLFLLVVTSCVILIAIAIKNTSSTLIGGISIGSSFLIISNVVEISYPILGIINPVKLTIDYLYGGLEAPLILDVFIGWFSSVLISIVLLILSYFLFEQEDIKGG